MKENPYIKMIKSNKKVKKKSQLDFICGKIVDNYLVFLTGLFIGFMWRSFLMN